MRTETPSIVTEEGSAEKARVRPVLGAAMETSPRSLNSARMRPLSRAISWAMSAEARTSAARPAKQGIFQARFALMGPSSSVLSRIIAETAPEGQPLRDRSGRSRRRGRQSTFISTF
jgi:hypothetical protein